MAISDGIYKKTFSEKEMKFTLDMNAIIDIDERREPANTYLTELIELHGNRGIEVSICMESASERQKNKRKPNTSLVFKKRIKKLGLSHLSTILPPAIFGHNCWGDSLWASKTDAKMVKEILQVLFNADDLTSLSNNQTCDANILSAHIINGGGVFVTQDREFLKKKDNLIAIGKRYYNCEVDILPPDKALLKAKDFICTHASDTACLE